MKIEKTYIQDLVIITPNVFEDERGFFMESYKKDDFQKLGVLDEFVQDNHSKSEKNIIRGLHFQWDKPMAKLMRVTAGEAFIVAVDIRKKSSTFGKWHGIIASAENKLQVFAPAGFARGFCSLRDNTEVQYKCTALYNKEAESGILYSDPEIGIEWPISNPELSEKDAHAMTLLDWTKKKESNYFN